MCACMSACACTSEERTWNQFILPLNTNACVRVSGCVCVCVCVCVGVGVCVCGCGCVCACVCGIMK